MSEFLTRFRIEPRKDYIKYKCWLVVYDKKLNKYIGEGRSYKRFDDSDQAYEWIQKEYK